MRRMRKLCTLRPHIGDARELEVVDAMDAEDHGESVESRSNPDGTSYVIAYARTCTRVNFSGYLA
jgi:hypothetical protein